jgi:hypothetical protein
MRPAAVHSEMQATSLKLKDFGKNTSIGKATVTSFLSSKS